MKGISFNFDNVKIAKSVYVKYAEKLSLEVGSMKKVLKTGYVDERCSINLSNDLECIKSCKEVVNSLNFVNNLIVIGIGGSNLGVKAVYESLRGKLSNEFLGQKVYFADTVDTGSILDIIDIMKKGYRNREKFVLNVISKSGSTTETIANFRVLLDILKKNQVQYRDYVVVTTDLNSKLDRYAKEERFKVLYIPHMVGGRYSVFSSVGVFPLMFLGVDIKKMFKGANDIKKICFERDVDKNVSMKSAISIFEHNLKGKNIFNTFLFSSRLESLGKWYRQLLAESCGKEFSRSNREKINVGVTPMVSIGSTDLHSMAQLFLGGPNDKFHCFVDVNNSKGSVKIKVSPDKELDEIVEGISKKKLSDIMSAITLGVKSAFVNKNIPFSEIEFVKVDEYNLGAFLQMKMIEVMFVGVLLNVNPFDQPNVEEYKTITRDNLSF